MKINLSMKKICSLVILICCFANGISQTEKSLLWRITGRDLPRPSYLYGTIHMICPEDLKLDDSLVRSVEMSNRLFFEIDMDAPGMMLKTMKLSMLSSGSLRDLMKPEDYEELSGFVKDSLGLPMVMLNRMKPIVLMSMLYTKALTCKTPGSYEEALSRLAKKLNVPISGLETLEDQMSIFDQIPDSTEIQMLMNMVKHFNDHRTEFDSMIQAYKSKDLSRLGSMISAAPDISGFEDLLLVNRNKKWISVMQDEMKKSGCLFAVGAGHLPGANGLIQLLRQTGFSVSPVDQ
jgi:uncharacterized protein YbaP (TraB family)